LKDTFSIEKQTMMNRMMMQTTSRAVRTKFSVAKRAMSTASYHTPLDYPVISKEDFGQFKEYSVIHTDRSLNLMSDPFQRVMRDLNELLKITYNADQVVIIPGCVF
jgi:hypothetical protein